MTCRDIIEFLADYAAGTVTAEERTIFEAHLAICPPCVAYLRTRFPHAQVNAEPAGLVGAPLRTVVRHLLAKPDFVILWARVWESPATREVAQITREISHAKNGRCWPGYL